jgi:hypothetical protein
VVVRLSGAEDPADEFDRGMSLRTTDCCVLSGGAREEMFAICRTGADIVAIHAHRLVRKRVSRIDGLPFGTAARS